MNIYSFASLLAFLFCLNLGVFVFTRRQKDKRRKLFGIASIFTAWWTLFPFLASQSYDDKTALLFARLVYVPAIFTASCWLHFTLSIVKERFTKKEKKILYLSYGSSALLLPFLFSSVFIQGLTRFAPHFSIIPGIIYPVFVSFFGLNFGYIILMIIKGLKTAKGYQRNQLKYILLSFIFGILSGLIHFYAVYLNTEPFPHDFLLVVYISLMAYAIARYRILDIKLAFTRASIFVIVYTIILGIPFAVTFRYGPWLSAAIGGNWWVAPFSLMAILATTGPFIYIYLNRKAEERLLKEQKSYQSILRHASLEMTRFKDLRVLLEFIVHIVTGAVRMQYAAVYLLDRDNSYYKLESMRAKEGKSGFFPRVEMSCALVKWLSDKKEPLVTGEIKRHLQDRPQKDLEELKNQMELMNAALIVPSFVENKLLAFMALGDKSSGEIYTPDDLHVFTVLAAQAALAIENARFLEDAREMQEQISQAEKMATIGTMADGLSHQINNRFHALSLIAGDTLDTIKLADAGQYSPEQKDLLGQVRRGLERILANVVQGGEVVKGMLKYSRKGEEGFSAVSLDKVIDSTLEMVQYKIKLSRIDIAREYPKDAPAIRGNLTQLQEVFFNLIDNAYDAMMERKDVLKEDGYRPKIRIYTEDTHNGTIRIKIEDNGMGVRLEDFKKMFTPFFTTKVSSRKGTGLGLYVIKKIVAANHQGKISVESNYRQGTTFILDLPLYKSKEE